MRSTPEDDLGSRRDQEATRIREEFLSRTTTGPGLRPEWRSWMLAVQERERYLHEELIRRGMDIASIEVLDVGCGVGGQIARLIAAGADPSSLHGLDLREDVIEAAQRRLPLCDIRVGDASEMDFDPSSMDLVMQQTALSSILDERLRQQVAAEMIRVCRPGGLIVSYDFRWNPKNPATRGIGAQDLKELFPDCTIKTRRATLAPPIARPLARRSWRVAAALGTIPLLRSHLMAFISPPKH